MNLEDDVIYRMYRADQGGHRELQIPYSQADHKEGQTIKLTNWISQGDFLLTAFSSI